MSRFPFTSTTSQFIHDTHFTPNSFNIVYFEAVHSSTNRVLREALSPNTDIFNSRTATDTEMKLPTIPGLEIALSVDGEDLQEYDDERYIEGAEHTRFV